MAHCCTAIAAAISMAQGCNTTWGLCRRRSFIRCFLSLSCLVSSCLYSSCLFSCYHSSGSALPADHNEDDVFAVLPIPPRVRKPKGLPPRGVQHPPRPSLQGRSSPVDHGKLRNISFKGKEDSAPISLNASGTLLSALHGTVVWCCSFRG